MPTSNISRAIARLESQSGVRLLHRTTRAVKPTSDGRDLFASVAAAVVSVRSAARSLEPASRKPKGRLRVPQLNCVADEASGRLIRVLPAFQARGATLYVVYPSAKQVPARVTAFRDFVSEAFSAWSARHTP